MPVNDNLADRVDGDSTRGRILYADDSRANIGVDRGILKCEISVLKDTVLEGHVLHIAKALIGLNRAVHKPDVRGVPAEVLALDLRIGDKDILTVPESVL